MQTHGINVGGTVTIQVGPVGKKPTNVLVLPVNPDQVLAHNMRTTVTQTLSGIYVDRFGAGIQTVNLSGTTAWNSPLGKFNGNPVDGNTAAKHLYRDIILYYENQQLSKPNSMVMEIFNDVTGEAWQVEPVNTPSFQRTNQSPMVLYYSIDFVVLRDLTTGHQVQKVQDPIVQTFSSPKSVKQYSSTKVTTAKNKAVQVKQTPYVIRTVKSGENLWNIARSYLPKQATPAQVQKFVDEIASLNHLSNPDLIFPGEKLKIPPTSK